jgi:hypothetical protein
MYLSIGLETGKHRLIEIEMTVKSFFVPDTTLEQDLSLSSGQLRQLYDGIKILLKL